MHQAKMEGEGTFHREGEKARSKLRMGSKGPHLGNCKYFRKPGMYVCWRWRRGRGGQKEYESGKVARERTSRAR